MSMKNSSDTIGNRTRDHAICRAVPQSTVPPHTPTFKKIKEIKEKQERELLAALRKIV
jgi:hypothetical protein